MGLLTTPEVAAKLGVTVARVQALIWNKRLPARKLGRDYVVDERDLRLISSNSRSESRAENETTIIKRYWKKLGRGTLALEYPIVYRDKPQTRGHRTLDAVIITNGERRMAKKGENLSLTDEDIIVIEANNHRLGMGLMGQAIFAARLVERYKPKSIRSVAICGADDPVLRPLLAPFRDVELIIDHRASSSPAPKLAPRDRPRIERFWKSTGGILIDNYPLVQRSEESGPYIAHAIILKNKEPRRLNRKNVSLEGQDVLILHTTSKRLSTFVMGIALFSAGVVMQSKPKSVRSIILCWASDSALQPLLAPYPYVEVVPDKD